MLRTVGGLTGVKGRLAGLGGAGGIFGNGLSGALAEIIFDDGPIFGSGLSGALAEIILDYGTIFAGGLLGALAKVLFDGGPISVSGLFGTLAKILFDARNLRGCVNRTRTVNDCGRHTFLGVAFVAVEVFLLVDIVVEKGGVDAVSCASRSLLSLSARLPLLYFDLQPCGCRLSLGTSQTARFYME